MIIYLKGWRSLPRFRHLLLRRLGLGRTTRRRACQCTLGFDFSAIQDMIQNDGGDIGMSIQSPTPTPGQLGVHSSTASLLGPPPPYTRSVSVPLPPLPERRSSQRNRGLRPYGGICRSTLICLRGRFQSVRVICLCPRLGLNRKRTRVGMVMTHFRLVRPQTGDVRLAETPLSCRLPCLLLSAAGTGVRGGTLLMVG